MNNRRNLLVNEPECEFVDLGLPSGLKWAKGNLKKLGNTCVIGEETDYGDFWSWANVGLTHSKGWMGSVGGEMTQTMYDSTTGKRQSASISDTDASHDVAYKYLGTPWRLPSKVDFNELIANTDNAWTTINGINGYKFMRKNDHSVYIFFPASGYCRDSGLGSRALTGYYWSSTYSSSTRAYYMVFGSSGAGTNLLGRFPGLSVRPVQ